MHETVRRRFLKQLVLIGSAIGLSQGCRRPARNALRNRLSEMGNVLHPESLGQARSNACRTEYGRTVG